jgi:hypothetical protein
MLIEFKEDTNKQVNKLRKTLRNMKEQLNKQIEILD